MIARRAPHERLVETAFALGWALTRHSPEPVAERLLEHAADRIYRQQGAGVRQLRANLARSGTLPGPVLDQLTQDAMRSYFRYWHEAFRLPGWSASRVVDSVVTSNEQPLRSAYAEGRGAVIALPHMANWDLAGAWACLTGMPVSTVAERLEPKTLFDRFVAYRERLGMEVIPLSEGARTMSALRSSIGRRRLVCLVADRDLTNAGAEVMLLGEAARLPIGPAALAAATGAPLLAATLSFRGPLLRIDFSEPQSVRRHRDDINAATQTVADWFTAGIRRHAVDWHMLQPVFVADLRRRAVV